MLMLVELPRVSLFLVRTWLKNYAGRYAFQLDSWGHKGILTPSEVVAAMAMVTARTEDDWEIRGFSSVFRNLGITARDHFNDIIRKTSSMTFGSTDCAVPMLWALKNNYKTDVFCIYTDHETWYGEIHPVQALQHYRDKTGINAKLVVVGIEATDFTIADPNDPGTLDVVGFDSAAPNIISEFVRL